MSQDRFLSGMRGQHRNDGGVTLAEGEALVGGSAADEHPPTNNAIPAARTIPLSL
jgi:hypothetical protein